MADFWARLALGAYDRIGRIVYPFVGVALRRRAARGKEDRARRKERYGYASHPRPEGPVIWLHAASVGESLAIMPLIEKLEAFGISMVLTTGTVTSAGVVKERLAAGTVHQYVPLDLPRAIERFVGHWKPDLAIFAESEIWPTIISELGRRRVPQILVNARMSDRSDERWRKRSGVASKLFSKLSLVVAQSDLDAKRFGGLGAPRVVEAGNLKNDVVVVEPDAKTIASLKEQIGGRPTWIAVSTHAGDEALVGRTQAMIREHRDDALVIVVPRHPDRSDSVKTALREQGLSVVTRSSGTAIDAKTQVFLGDTIGDMGLYLALAPVAFMGKSLDVQGGQNPVEPVLTETAILSGRYVQNFRSIYEALLASGGARLVADEAGLAAQVLQLWDKDDERLAMCEAASKTVAEMAGALDRTMEAIDPFIMPLRVQAQLDLRARRDALAAAAPRPNSTVHTDAAQ